MKEYVRYCYLLLIFIGSINIVLGQEALTGKVLNELSEPIQGVSVQVLGDENRATSTNQEGKFEISVNTGEKLRFYLVGYENQDVTITSLSPLTATMQPKDEVIDEVVVIGYGSQRRSDVIAPVSKFNAEGLQERPI